MAIDWDKTIVLQDDDSVDIISGRTVLYMNSLTEPMPGPAQGYVREPVIAPEFDPTAEYTYGDYVFHQGILYRFRMSYIPSLEHEWNPSKVEEVTVTDAFVDENKLEDILDADYAKKAVIAEEFDPNAEYIYGSYVFHEGKLYRFRTSYIPSLEHEWNPNKVEEIVVADEFIDTNRLASSLEDFTKKAIIAPEFDKDTAYSVGDYVFHDDKLYIFTSNHIAGAAWDSSIVLEKTISEQFIDYAKLNGALASYVPKSDIAETFDAQESYAAGDFVYYNGILYRFTQAHIGTAWNPAHVVAVTVGEEIIPDAPSNGKTYGRKDGAWAEAVAGVKWGDITGRLQDQSDIFYMRNYYVDGTNGSDDNAGTSSQPFKTVAKAVQSIPYTMQGKVHIAAGNYNENFAYEDKDINFYIEGNVNFTHNMGGVIRRSKTRFIGDVQVFPQLSFKNNLQIYDSDVTFYAVDLAFTGLYNWESTYYAVAAYRSHVILGTIVSAQLYSKVGGYSVIHALHSYVQVDLILGSSVKATNLLEAGENAVVAYKTDTYPASADVDNYEHVVYNGRIIHGTEVEAYSKTETDALLATKQNVLTFDTVPTENSTNPVTSDGIKTALDGKSDPVTGSASGSLISLTDAADAPVADLTVAIEPVQEGTGDPSPSNVRAITGWDVCKVVSTGKNLCDKFISNDFSTGTIADGVFTSTQQTGTGYMNLCRLVLNHTVALKAGVTYYYSLDIKMTSGAGAINTISLMDASNTAVARTSISIPTPTSSYQHFILKCTPTDDVTIAKIFVQSRQCTDAVFAVTNPMISIEPIDASTAYEPYNGQTVTIDLGGTRYGGMLDVLTGVLTVDKVSVDLGTLNWSFNTDYHIGYVAFPGKKPGRTNFMASSYKVVNKHYNDMLNGEAAGVPENQSSNTSINIKDDRFSDATDFKNGVSGQTIVYELAEPQTYQLTPAEVRTILGECHVWADTGDITSLMYWKVAGKGIAEAVSNASANAKYDDGQTRAMITNSIETTNTASKSYSAGNLIILNGQLLRATTGIGIGGTITIGSNAEVITLETIIAELSA